MAENELRALRIDLGLPAKDMVAVVQGLYPKYDKTMQSKVRERRRRTEFLYGGMHEGPV